MKRKSTPEIPVNVMNGLRSLFPGVDDWEIPGTILARRNGEFFHARSRHGSISVAVKIFSRKIPRSLSDPGLIDSLDAYHQHPGLTIPRVLAVTTEPDAVIMEWIDSPTMTDLLRKHRFSPARRLEHIERAGRWLAWFHSVSVPARETYNHRAVKKKFAHMIRTRGSQPRGALARHLESWERINAGIGPFEIAHAILHNDFTPFNLFVDETRVIGFDIFGGSRGPVTHDVCRFLTYLGVLPSDGGEFLAFMKGYGMAADGIPCFLYLQYTEILRRRLSLDTQSLNGGFRIRRQLQIAKLARMARRASDELGKSGF